LSLRSTPRFPFPQLEQFSQFRPLHPILSRPTFSAKTENSTKSFRSLNAALFTPLWHRALSGSMSYLTALFTPTRQGTLNGSTSYLAALFTPYRQGTLNGSMSYLTALFTPLRQGTLNGSKVLSSRDTYSTANEPIRGYSTHH
jgi:hypothetical protein